MLVFKLFRTETATPTVPSPAFVITLGMIKHRCLHHLLTDVLRGDTPLSANERSFPCRDYRSNSPLCSYCHTDYAASHLQLTFGRMSADFAVCCLLFAAAVIPMRSVSFSTLLRNSGEFCLRGFLLVDAVFVM